MNKTPYSPHRARDSHRSWLFFLKPTPNLEYAAERPAPMKEQIPEQVMKTYQSDRMARYKTLFGATISFCRIGDKAGYRLSGNGGIEGMSIYFDVIGREFNRHAQGDTLPNGYVPPRSSFDGFACTELINSKTNVSASASKLRNHRSGFIVGIRVIVLECGARSHLVY